VITYLQSDFPNVWRRCCCWWSVQLSSCRRLPIPTPPCRLRTIKIIWRHKKNIRYYIEPRQQKNINGNTYYIGGSIIVNRNYYNILFIDRRHLWRSWSCCRLSAKRTWRSVGDRATRFPNIAFTVFPQRNHYTRVFAFPPRPM